MRPHFLIWSFGPKAGSVDGILCQLTDCLNRLYLLVKTGSCLELLLECFEGGIARKELFKEKSERT